MIIVINNEYKTNETTTTYANEESNIPTTAVQSGNLLNGYFILIIKTALILQV